MADDGVDLPIPPEDLPAVQAQAVVAVAANGFLAAFYARGDLTEAWPSVDPTLRLVWAQSWAQANEDALNTNGYPAQAAAEKLADQGPEAPLWDDFSRVILRDVRAAYPLDYSSSGIGATPRAFAPDVEVLYVHRQIPPGGIWPEGAISDVLIVVMRHDQAWRVLNLGTESIPQPGWPPSVE